MNKTTPQQKKIEDFIASERKGLYKGCGGSEEYHGHQCKSTFVNTNGKKVTVYCNGCEAKLKLLSKLSKLLKCN